MASTKAKGGKGKAAATAADQPAAQTPVADATATVEAPAAANPAEKKARTRRTPEEIKAAKEAKAKRLEEAAAKAKAEAEKAAAPKPPPAPRRTKAEKESDAKLALKKSDTDYKEVRNRIADTGEVYEFPYADLDFSLVEKVRAKLNPAVVADYAATIARAFEAKQPSPLPPIKVYVTAEGVPLVLGGWHRSEAYRKGSYDIPGVIVTAPSYAEAAKLAISDNAANGQRLSRKDMHKAVTLALTDGGMSGQDATASDRAVAELVGCSHPTVAAIRKKLIKDGVISETGERLGKDGRKLDTSNIGGTEGWSKNSMTLGQRRLAYAREVVLSDAAADDVAPIFVDLTADQKRIRQLLAAMYRKGGIGPLNALGDMVDRVITMGADKVEAEARDMEAAPPADGGPLPEMAAAAE